MAMLDPKDNRAVVLILSKVKFPSSSDLYRAQVAVTNGSLPITVWLESLRTTLQWECDVTCFDDHKPLTAGYALPSEMVLSALMSVLTSSSKRARGGHAAPNTEHYEVDLLPVAGHGGRKSLQLALQAFVGLRAEYNFEMVPREREPLDVLRSQVFAVQESVEELRAHTVEAKEETLSSAHAQVEWLCVSTDATTRSGAAVQWSVHARLPDDLACFVDDAETTLTVQRSGLYHIQVSGPCSSSAGQVSLSVDDVRVAVAAAVKQDTSSDDRKAKNRLHLSHITSLDANARIRISVQAGACDHSKCADAGRCKKVKFGGFGEATELRLHALGTHEADAPATDSE